MLTRTEVVIQPTAGVDLAGELRVPPDPLGVVVFAHGSGSSRFSPRNQQVAAHLNSCGIATLLFDLLTEPESADRENVFDIDLLKQRLVAAIDALAQWPVVAGLPVGLFGASTGAAAALAAAVLRPAVVAVVSRGGRPDLAWDYLPSVATPVLLIVGGADRQVLELNESAAARLAGRHEMRVIPGATHLFAEPGTLRLAATAAADWFSREFRG